MTILDRIDEATRRVTERFAPMRIPADPNGDVDLVLSECRALIVEFHAACYAAVQYLEARGIRHMGTEGRTRLLPMLDAVLAKADAS